MTLQRGAGGAAPPALSSPLTSFDVVVIGSGPGGEGAAMSAARFGKRVAVVERFDRVGGASTHWATIPSKTIRHFVKQAHEFRDHPLFAARFAADPIGYPEILAAASGVIDRLAASRAETFRAAGVEVIRGHGRLDGPGRVRVEAPDGSATLLEAAAVVLAPGSRPYRPPGVDFTHPRLRDSDTILTMPFTPRTMVVYGAGVVGCEYASLFARLGVAVSLVDARPRLLSFLDDELSAALAVSLAESGVTLHPAETFREVRAGDARAEAAFASGLTLTADVFLWANGRTGNGDAVGLDTVGLAADGRGQVKTSGCYETGVPGIYAVGDLAGYPCLAGAAYDQGRIAGTHLGAGYCELRLADEIPTGIYTVPEIACAGKTERELAEAGIPYAAGRAPFRHLARAHITGRTEGWLKLLFHRETRALLGVHAIGENAADLVHLGLTIRARKDGANTIDHFIGATFNYPTWAEAYRTAALDGLAKL